jgi:Cu(I)/Ag(I) efflux system membrane fusion protein
MSTFEELDAQATGAPAGRADAAESPAPADPFGARTTGRRRAVRWAIYATILLVAVVAVYLATRGTGGAVADAGHVHGADAGADAPQPVMLIGDEAERIGVTYAAATVGSLGREIRTVGQVTFDETRVTAVSTKVDGWVERLHLDFTGKFVAAGAPLFAIYSPMLVSAQEELLLARRLEADVAKGSDEARANAAALVSSARRRLAYWDVPASVIAHIESSGEVQRTVTLRAPASGFVVTKNVLQGQRVMAGESLYQLADLRTVWIEGEVFEQDLPSIRLGQRVTAVVQALPGRELVGRITYIHPTLDAETRTVRVRVELSNAGYRLKPGMYATLRVAGTARPEVLSVPRSAVLVTGERSLVFVRRDDGMLEPREVTLGVANDTRIEILSGLAAGETVVASATFLVDAESNLGTVMGGMGNMPGMDMTAPAKAPPDAGTGAPPTGGAPVEAPPRDPHAGHEE